MIKTTQCFLAGALLIVLSTASTTLQAAAPTEAQLIAELDSPKANKVTSALLKLEKEYPTSTNALPKMVQLLSDSRPEVRRKAGRVLGVLHADLNPEALNKIAAMLKSPDNNEVIDALKSLRGLKAAQTVPEIVPLLNHPFPNVVRDACRTLAVLGNKDTVPAIEPLLTHPNNAVKKDAQDAIFTLKGKG